MRRPPQYRDQIALHLLHSGRLATDPHTGAVRADDRVYLDISRGDYIQITIDRIVLRAHRIVWLDAQGPIPDGFVINHRDRNRSNNRLANLEAVTYRQNALHAVRSAAYEGTYPDDDEKIAAEFIRAAEYLTARGGVDREELLALVGKNTTPENLGEYDDLVALMTEPGALRRPRHAVG
jgi:hypothetical protein